MNYIYFAIFAISVVILALCVTVFGQEIMYNFKKWKIHDDTALKQKFFNIWFKMSKRMLKTTAILAWIAYETYVKGIRPNTYTMGSWLFNIKIVEGREYYILGIIAIVFIVSLVLIRNSRERLIKAISIEKRAFLKKRVKTWDETKLTPEQKEEIFARFNGDGDDLKSLARVLSIA